MQGYNNLFFGHVAAWRQDQRQVSHGKLELSRANSIAHPILHPALHGSEAISLHKQQQYMHLNNPDFPSQ